MLSPLYFRAGRLTDGPYTSYDLNTLLKATAGQRRAVLIGQGLNLTQLNFKLLDLFEKTFLETGLV